MRGGGGGGGEGGGKGGAFELLLAPGPADNLGQRFACTTRHSRDTERGTRLPDGGYKAPNHLSKYVYIYTP